MGSRRLSRGMWYHVAVTFKFQKQGIRLYINGKLLMMTACIRCSLHVTHVDLDLAGKLDKTATPTEQTRSNLYPVHIGRPSQGYCTYGRGRGRGSELG